MKLDAAFLLCLLCLLTLPCWAQEHQQQPRKPQAQQQPRKPQAQQQAHEPQDQPLPPEPHDQLRLECAQIMSRKANGKVWDQGFGKTRLPDPMLKVYIYARGEWVAHFTSKVIRNTLVPEWKQIVPVVIQPGMRLKLYLYDKDLRHDDLIGSTVITIPDIYSDEIIVRKVGQIAKLEFSIKWDVPSLSDQQLIKFTEMLVNARQHLNDGELQTAFEIYQPLQAWYMQNHDNARAMNKFSAENGWQLCEGLGRYYLAQHDLTKAQKWFREAVPFVLTLDRQKRGALFYSLAITCAGFQSDHMECLDYLEKALREDQQMGRTYWLTKAVEEQAFDQIRNLPEFKTLIKSYQKQSTPQKPADGTKPK